MENLSLKENKLLYLILFIIIYISQETLLFGTNQNTAFTTLGNYVGIIMFFPLCFMALHKNGRVIRGYNARGLVITLLIFISLVLTIVLNGEGIRLYIMMFSIIMDAFLIAALIPKQKFIVAFCNIMYWLAIISLIALFVFKVFPQVTNFFPSMQNFLGYHYKTYYLGSFSLDSLSSSLTRNPSIFRESGVATIYFNLALMFELNYLKHKRFKNIIVDLIAVVSTMSTTGLIVLLLQIMVFVFLEEKMQKSKKIYISFVLVVMLAVVVLLENENLMHSSVLGKLSEGLQNDSFASRWASIVTNLRIFGEYPFFGCGYYYMSDNYSSLSYQLFSIRASSNTNSFLSCLSLYGIGFCVFAFRGWFSFIKKNLNLITAFSLFLVVILLFSGEYMLNNILFYIPIYYGLGMGEDEHENSISEL